MSGKNVCILTRQIITAGGAGWVAAKQAAELGGDLWCTEYNRRVYPNLLDEDQVNIYGGKLSISLLENTINTYNYVFNTDISFLEDYDVVIVHNPLSMLLAIRAKKSFENLKVIWYCHHPHKGIYGIHQERSLISRALMYPMKRYDRRAYQKVDKIFVNSKNTLENQLKKCYRPREDIEVLYPPIKTYGKSKKEGDYALIISRVRPFKQFEIAVDALAELEEDIPLKIAGSIQDEEYRAEIQRKAENQGVNVEFLGFVPESNLEELIHKSKFGVFTSEEEDFGLVPLEFMSTGKVCFVPESAGVSEIIEKKYRYSDDLSGIISSCGSFIDYSLVDNIEKINENHFKKLEQGLGGG